MKFQQLLTLVGVILGWGLKSVSDSLTQRKEDVARYRVATFYVFRAHKSLMEIHIRRAWTQGKLGKPKSRLSWRPVPVVNGLATLMEAWSRDDLQLRHRLHLPLDQAGWKTAAH